MTSIVIGICLFVYLTDGLISIKRRRKWVRKRFGIRPLCRCENRSPRRRRCNRMSVADDINRIAHEWGCSSGEILDKYMRMCETYRRMLDGLPPRDDEEVTERETFAEVVVDGPAVVIERVERARKLLREE